MAHLLAGVDSIWEQEKLEARKLLLNRADSHLSGAPKKMGESHHFIRENGGLYKVLLQFAGSLVKKRIFAYFRPPF